LYSAGYVNFENNPWGEKTSFKPQEMFLFPLEILNDSHGTYFDR